MSGDLILRGRVYLTADDPAGRCLVVSNDSRNRQFSHVLAVRLTTEWTLTMPTVVELAREGLMRGHALCDRIETVSLDEIGPDLGALSPSTMRRVDAGLRVALNL